MAYIIGSSCIDTMDRACMDQCPVDCIYEGGRKLYINPVECIDCGACEAACPMEAISNETTVPAADVAFVADNAAFFDEPLPGRDTALGNPGGAAGVGRIGLDTRLVGTL
ncbi:MAG: (4Fe-4S)-binding protein [Pseudonocardia sp. SCN 72-86]|nr:MAG: (4Fe-4S)-binding protein [Pseudonocardia sp. SCN 72-86]